MKWIIALVFLVSLNIASAQQMTGVASWYGKVLQGNYTASGEKFDYRKLTAAHKNLPFGTHLKVINLKNHKSIYVVVNDRLPQTSKRIIDLSEQAARELGYYRAGITPVLLEIIQPEPPLADYRVR